MKMNITILNSIDPVGNIILSNNKVYRGINKEYIEKYTIIYNICSQNKLLGSYIIDTKIAEDFVLEPFDLIFEHKLIKPFIYPFEWTLAMIIDAAYTALNLLIKLDDVGLGLKDGHRFNVAYHEGTFYWIDFGSIILNKTSSWVFEEFINSFINSIICMSQGIFHSRDISTCLADEHQKKYNSVKTAVLAYADEGKISKAVKLLYQWIRLYEINMDILPYNLPTPISIPCALVNFMKETQITRALVISGNFTDLYFELEQHGISVTVFNENANYVDFIYSHIKQRATSITPVFIDFSNPNSTNDGCKWFKAEIRFPAEMVIVFDQFVHANQTEFDVLLKNLKPFTVRYAAIEIVYPYNEEFINAIKQEFDIIAITNESFNNGNRLLFVKVKDWQG